MTYIPCSCSSTYLHASDLVTTFWHFSLRSFLFNFKVIFCYVNLFFSIADFSCHVLPVCILISPLLFASAFSPPCPFAFFGIFVLEPFLLIWQIFQEIFLEIFQIWPNIFNKDTVVQYKWDLSDLSLKLQDIVTNYNKYIEYAVNLQEQYKHYSFGEVGQNEFCKYFINMVKN